MPSVLEPPKVRRSTKYRRHTWGRRIAISIIRLAILAAIFATFGSGYYLARRGFGREWRYRVVEEFPEVADSLVVDLEYLGRESFLPLFVVLREGGASVPPDLRRRLFHAIRTRISPRHVPDEVFAIPEVPRTLSGKKMEVPVRKILLGHPVERAANRDAMAKAGHGLQVVRNE